MKVKIITPVHVGTGQDIESFSLLNDPLDNTKLNRYDAAELLGQLPFNVLSDERFLKEFSKQQPSRKTLDSTIKRYIKHDQSKLLYKLDIKSSSEIKYGVSEIVKDCFQPYIPGSSIKGAFLTAWYYYFFKINYKFISLGLPKYIQSEKEKQKASGKKFKLAVTAEKLLWIMYCEYNQIGFNNNIRKASEKTIDNKEFMNIIKKIFGCICCLDVYFNDIGIYSVLRVGTGKEMVGEMDRLPMAEAIIPNQIAKSDIINILDFELNALKVKYQSDKFVTLLLTYVNKKILLKACNVYSSDMLDEELTPIYENLYDKYQPINNQLKELKEIANQSVLMRIGGSTNYNFKTISLLIKKNDPKLYEEYFFDMFFRGPNPKKKVKAETMPKTRVIYYSDSEYIAPNYITPGYIEIIDD